MKQQQQAATTAEEEAEDSSSSLVHSIVHMVTEHLQTLDSTAVRAILWLSVAYTIGYWGLSTLWIALLTGIWVYGWYREATLLEAQAVVELRKEVHHVDSVGQLYQGVQNQQVSVPHWLRFHPTEPALFLNSLLTLLWPFVKQASEESILASLAWVFDSYCPSFLTSLKCSEFDLGATPIRFTGVRVDTSYADEVTLDLGIEFIGDPSIAITAATGPVSVVALLRKLRIIGTLRICLKPLTGTWPTFEAVLIGFAGKPLIDFDLDAAKVNLDYIPGFSRWLRRFLTETLAYYLVWPRKIVIPMLDMSEQAIANLYAIVPLGMLTITDVTATGLKLTSSSKKAKMVLTVALQGERHKETSAAQVYNAEVDSVCWEQDVFQFPVSDPTVQAVDFCIAIDGVNVAESLLSCDVFIPYLTSRYQQSHTLSFSHRVGGLDLNLLWKPFKQASASASAAPSEHANNSSGSSNPGGDVKGQAGSGGVLVVNINKGENLIIQDLTSSDPYITLQLGEGLDKDLRADMATAAATTAAAAAGGDHDENDDSDSDVENGNDNDNEGEGKTRNKKKKKKKKKQSKPVREAKTAVIMKSLDPVWDETFSLTMVDIDDPLHSVLHVQVMDWDRFDSDDFMGKIDINCATLRPSERTVKTYTLQGVEHGTVEISLTYLPFLGS